ncbi:MAG: undecaprenyl-diphosphate phosphatase, partial [Bacteriovoracia bacterium]
MLQAESRQNLQYMGYFEAFLFGLVQGITEYLPVSSSAHLILLPRFLGTTDPGLTFDVFLHVGTLFATLAYFWRDWLGILRDPKGLFKFDGEGVTLGVLAVATLPALIFGAALHGFIETSLRANAVLVCSLSLGGLLLYVVDAKARQDRAFETIRLRD